MLKRALFLCGLLMIPNAFAGEKSIRYVALGDSYTIGTGAQFNQSWPAVMTAHLQIKGVAIELTANLAHNGWTSRNLIDGQLSQLKELKPDFVTVLIGANDIVQGVEKKIYQDNIRYIIEELLKQLPSQQIVIVTIPDFSVTPMAKQFAYGRDLTQEIKAFNHILMQEALAHKLKVVDLYPFSQNMGKDPTLTAPDGLHPSPKGYAQWAFFIESNLSL